MSDTTTVDFRELADQYRAKIDEANSIGSDERQKARVTRDQERNRLYTELTEANETARKAHDEAREAADAVYRELITSTDAQRAAAIEEIKTGFLAEVEGLTEEQAKVLSFMVTSSWWHSRPDHCRIILQAMPFEDYDALRTFGSRRGWCEEYDDFLAAAMEADAFSVDATEYARSELTRVVNAETRYDSSRAQINAKVDQLIKATVAQALRDAEKGKDEDAVPSSQEQDVESVNA